MLMDTVQTLASFTLAFSDVAGAATAGRPAPAGTVELFTVANLIAVVTLSAMEIVLGIDNVVFVAIIAGRAKPQDRDRVRKIGLMLGVVLRILLLLCISWLVGLKATLFTLMGHDFSGKDLVLLTGGLFLIYKSVKEIHHKVEGAGEHPSTARSAAGMSLATAIAQIAIIDLVFSLDSVITAVGMVQNIWVMVVAVLLSAVVMISASGPIAGFVDRHPAIKVLALSFLILIGVMLVAESLGEHINKGYIYFAMAFSLVVEVINMRIRKASNPTSPSDPSSNPATPSHH